jgi:hypothetical protein
MYLSRERGYVEVVYSVCRFCGGPGTQGDGPGAPCFGCIREVVASVAGVPIGSASDRSIATVQTPVPSTSRRREPMPLTVVERTLVRRALDLPGLASDIALAGALPMLAIEIAIRTAARTRWRA